MSAHLADGATILAMAPASAQSGPPYAFWIADPATGTLRDENVLGRHVELVERTSTTRPAVQAVPKWRLLACNVVAAAMLTVTGDSGFVEGTSIQDAAAKAALGPEEQTICGP